MLYSYKNQYPKPLPFRLVFPDGTTRTDPHTFTAEEIARAGYVPVSDPPVVEYPNRIEWVDASWQVRGPNDSETQAQVQAIQQHCKQLLDDTDYKVIKAVEAGVPVEPNLKTYRQQLRDLYNNVPDPWNVIWPVLFDSSVELEIEES